MDVATDTGIVGEDKVGKYKVARVLSLGQASEILEVVQDGSSKRFALKQLLASRAAESSERRAFEHEAKLGMDLSHPKLIRVYEYVKDKERPYFVMEYFQSMHLRLPIGKPRDYPLPGARRHKILSESAQALAYMHDKGFVHRDIKPENIIFNKVGETRLIDYGLARKLRGGLGKLLGGKVPCQGTKSYMSPEQIQQKEPTPAADIYSFGITAYEVACGRQPFRANSPAELLMKHVKEQPNPPTSYNKDITPEFSDLIMKMIKKRPQDRFQSLHEFILLFRNVRIYKDDPDPRAGQDMF